MRLAVRQAACMSDGHAGSSAEDEGAARMRTLYRRAGCRGDGGVAGVDVERDVQGALTVRVYMHQRFLDDSAGGRQSAARARGRTSEAQYLLMPSLSTSCMVNASMPRDRMMSFSPSSRSLSPM